MFKGCHRDTGLTELLLPFSQLWSIDPTPVTSDQVQYWSFGVISVEENEANESFADFELAYSLWLLHLLLHRYKKIF